MIGDNNWYAEYLEKQKITKENAKKNLKSSFRAFVNAGVVKATMNYSGSGDSGWFGENESCSYTDANGKEIDPPEVLIEELEQLLDNAYLEPGWVNNEGGQGYFNIDFVNGTIDHHNEVNISDVECNDESYKLE